MKNYELIFLTNKDILDSLMKMAKPFNKLNKFKKGIYLIVIGDVFYIGKTSSKKGFYSRYYTHTQKLKKYQEDLRQYGSFEEVFFTGKWHGNHLYSKMGAAVNVFKKEMEFYILEEYTDIDPDELLEIESSYIKKYMANFYGLNQMEIIILGFTLVTAKKETLNKLLKFKNLETIFKNYEYYLNLIYENDWKKYFFINFNWINSFTFFKDILKNELNYNFELKTINSRKYNKQESKILNETINNILDLNNKILFSDIELPSEENEINKSVPLIEEDELNKSVHLIEENEINKSLPLIEENEEEAEEKNISITKEKLWAIISISVASLIVLILLITKIR